MSETSKHTLETYEKTAETFWEGTRDHDVTQNIDALLESIAGTLAPPFHVLDFGCGPGRDLAAFKKRGHVPVGLDGCVRFVEMAKAHTDAKCFIKIFSRSRSRRARSTASSRTHRSFTSRAPSFRASCARSFGDSSRRRARLLEPDRPR